MCVDRPKLTGVCSPGFSRCGDLPKIYGPFAVAHRQELSVWREAERAQLAIVRQQPQIFASCDFPKPDAAVQAQPFRALIRFNHGEKLAVG